MRYADTNGHNIDTRSHCRKKKPLLPYSLDALTNEPRVERRGELGQRLDTVRLRQVFDECGARLRDFLRAALAHALARPCGSQCLA